MRGDATRRTNPFSEPGNAIPGGRETSVTNFEKGSKVERVAGIEPAYSAWKAAALPLCYTRDRSALRRRVRVEVVGEVGLEPTKAYAGRFTVSCDCHYTIPARGAAFRIRTEDLLFTKQLL